MYMVNRNQRRARLNQKSLISRNRVKTGFKQSARRLKERTLSMISLASTNWRSSSNVNLSTRSRHNSAADPSPSEGEGIASTSGRKRHMSMQDRVEMYNTVLEMEQEDKKEPETIQRKNSKVMFEPPQLEVTNENEKVVTEEVEAEVHQKINVPMAPRSRKVSKVSLFEFVPEEVESK